MKPMIFTLLLFSPPAAQQPLEDPLRDVLFPPEAVMQHQQGVGLSDEQKNNLKGEVRQAQLKFTELQWTLHSGLGTGRPTRGERKGCGNQQRFRFPPIPQERRMLVGPRLKNIPESPVGNLVSRSGHQKDFFGNTRSRRTYHVTSKRRTSYNGHQLTGLSTPGFSISDGDRVGLEGDKTADLHPASVSNQSTSARSEPASSTLLTPLTAQYHKFAVVGLMAFGEGRHSRSLSSGG